MNEEILAIAGLEKSSLWMSPRVRAEARLALKKIFDQV